MIYINNYYFKTLAHFQFLKNTRMDNISPPCPLPRKRRGNQRGWFMIYINNYYFKTLAHFQFIKTLEWTIFYHPHTPS